MKTIVASSLFLFADSAMGRDAMPLFLGPGQWRADVCLALRIGRLGKHVKPKFALRYVDSVSMVLAAAPRADEEYPAWLGIMDNAVTAGQWLPAPGDGLPDTADATVIYNDAREEAQYSSIRQAAAEAIAKVSALATIKTGDIIIPAFAPISMPIEPDTRLQASLLGVTCLDLKIK